MIRTRLITALFSSLILLTSCDAFPWLDQTIRLSDGHNMVRIMIRAGGGYRTIVFNKAGSVSWDSLPIARGKRYVSLYLTPENWLAVIEAGGDDRFIKVSIDRTPILVSPSRTIDKDMWSSKWRYLGAVIRDDDRLRLVSPKSRRECLPMLGAGDSPYRRQYQNEGSCPQD